MYVDLSEAQLREYRSTQTEPDDFGEFWDDTLAEARRHPMRADLVAADIELQTIEVFDVTFPGFAGEPIRGWVRVPRDRTGPLPVVVEYIGYGSGRGAAINSLLWASAGFAHFQMDSRGQGSVGSPGVTPDSGGSGPQAPGFVTRGISDPHDYYYRRIITDAVRAVDAARTLEFVDPARVAVCGRSQGGGLALAVAGLVPDLAAVAAAVPFLCDFPRAAVITDAMPYREIGLYLAAHRHSAEQVMRTLSYFDGVNFARRAMAPAIITAGLMDAVCPPSTIFAAEAVYAGESELVVWHYNGHEGGAHEDERLFLESFRRAFR